MTNQDFFARWQGQHNDFDGAYGGQCMDIANQFVVDVLGEKQLHGNAIDTWTNYDPNKFERIANTPTGVPLQGDLVVFDKTSTNPYGHIDIFVSGGVNSFTGFDQNFPLGSVCHFQSHNYTSPKVLGWLRHKSVSSGFDVSITASELNVRSDSNTGASIVSPSLKYGQHVHVIGSKQGTNVNGNSTWYQIDRGYISAYWTHKL